MVTESLNSRLRVMMLIPDFGDGGAQRQLAGLIGELTLDSRIELGVVTLGDTRLHDISRFPTFTRIGHRKSYRSLGTFRDVHSAAKAFRPDLIMSWLHPADIVAATVKARFRSITWIAAERDSRYPRRLLYRLRERFVRHADAIIANSQSGAKMWRELGYSREVRVIKNWVAVSDSQSGLERNLLNQVLGVGRLEHQKSWSRTIAVFAKFHERHPEATLLIVGEGTLRRELERQVFELGLDASIRIQGYSRDITRLMRESRLIVTLSLHEGTPNVLLEAIMNNLPPIASGIPEHTAVLGNTYEYLADLAGEDTAIAEVMTRAWESGSPHTLAKVRERIYEQTPAEIARSYSETFIELTRRRKNGVQT
jgi:glycosyltransferase involved in cell wall biosynthesis